MSLSGENFEMRVGDTKSPTFTVKDANGTPIDISGNDVTWAMRAIGGDTDLISKSSANSGEISISQNSGETGQFTVSILPADTADLSSGMYRHYAILTDNSNNKSTVSLGMVALLANNV